VCCSARVLPLIRRYCLSFRASEADALAPGADAVNETVVFFLALVVNCTRNETVKVRPAANAGSCCLSGLARTPRGAFRRSEPAAEVPAPVFVTLMLTDRHFPDLSVSGFGLAIEKTGGTDAGAVGEGDAWDPAAAEEPEEEGPEAGAAAVRPG
jgi:hypothetical protein